MAVVLMCLCGDEIAGIVTRCTRKATTLFCPPLDPVRRLPCCDEHRDALLAGQPKGYVLQLVGL